MAFEYPQYRENVQQLYPLQGGTSDWSTWRKVMVQGRNRGDGYTNRNNGHVGSYRLAQDFPGRGVCGIYEWMVRRRPKEMVVYVGSSCNAGSTPLRGRILQYCRNGSHKANLINHALRSGYELHLRWKTFRDVEQSQEAENILLSKYNYAWNIRNNGIRAPLE
jgi:hypothetical protein